MTRHATTPCPHCGEPVVTVGLLDGRKVNLDGKHRVFHRVVDIEDEARGFWVADATRPTEDRQALAEHRCRG